MKISWKPGTMLNPVPAVLVSVGDSRETWNTLTIAWVGTICTNPPMLSISVRPERASYTEILRTMEFTVNLTTEEMVRAVDYCGVRSGRDINKWEATGLTPLPGEKISSPTIEQSPLSIECKVKEIMHLGSHDMLIAEVINVRADSRWLDTESGKFRFEDAGLIAYSHGHYYSLGGILGKFGFSVEKTTR
ncbi:MAG: flavin reductase family protein [Clostridium sp.]|nr:flavin reductase family protein [Prevotella sp.]MCM1428639.1 flavin reductase family protein [Clostridium sp.]MCM1475768.1 flavin reductase family protein [Muribaculaceae bacterium]